MGCYNCDNLDIKTKQDGKVSGSLYYCKKIKGFVNPTNPNCNNYKKTYRKSWENDEIYKAGKDYYNDNTPIWFYLLIAIVLLILGLFMGVFW